MFYLAHPVAGDVANNLAAARRWLKWAHTAIPPRFPGHDVAVIAPWITDCEIYDDSVPTERAAGMARNLATITRCHGILLCGGRISSGMQVELDGAKGQGLVHILDLTWMGTEPYQGALCSIGDCFHTAIASWGGQVACAIHEHELRTP